MSDSVLLARLADMAKTIEDLEAFNKQWQDRSRRHARNLNEVIEALPTQFGVTFTGDFTAYTKAVVEHMQAAIVGLLKFHPESPETGAELPPECWAPAYFEAVNTARIAAGLPAIVLATETPEQSPEVPAGFELVAKTDTTMPGDLCWNGREWCHVDAVNDYVDDYIAVARKVGKTAERDAHTKAHIEEQQRRHREKN